MTQVVKFGTVTYESQAVFTERIDFYINRINECIVGAAYKQDDSCYFYIEADYCGNSEKYNIELPTEAIDYIIALYGKAGYIVEYKRNYWWESKRYYFYWEYAEPIVVNHTVSPISIPVNETKLNLIKKD